MKHVLKQMQYRFAVIYETLSNIMLRQAMYEEEDGIKEEKKPRLTNPDYSRDIYFALYIVKGKVSFRKMSPNRIIVCYYKNIVFFSGIN